MRGTPTRAQALASGPVQAPSSRACWRFMGFEGGVARCLLTPDCRCPATPWSWPAWTNRSSVELGARRSRAGSSPPPLFEPPVCPAPCNLLRLLFITTSTVWILSSDSNPVRNNKPLAAAPEPSTSDSLPWATLSRARAPCLEPLPPRPPPRAPPRAPPRPGFGPRVPSLQPRDSDTRPRRPPRPRPLRAPNTEPAGTAVLSLSPSDPFPSNTLVVMVDEATAYLAGVPGA